MNQNNSLKSHITAPTALMIILVLNSYPYDRGAAAFPKLQRSVNMGSKHRYNNTTQLQRSGNMMNPAMTNILTHTRMIRWRDIPLKKREPNESNYNQIKTLLWKNKNPPVSKDQIEPEDMKI